MQNSKASWQKIDLGRGGLFMYQDRRLFRLSEDAVCLAHYVAEIFPSARNYLEVCAGSGAITLLLNALLEKTSGVALELDELALKVLRANIELNRLEADLEVISCDLRSFPTNKMEQHWQKYDLLVANPPYRVAGSKFQPNSCELSLSKERARYDYFCQPKDLASLAERTINAEGLACFTYPITRELELSQAMKQQGFKLYNRRNLVNQDGKEAKIMLISFVRCLAEGRVIAKLGRAEQGDLVLRLGDGSYSAKGRSYYE